MSSFDRMYEQYGTDTRIIPEYIKDGPRAALQEQTGAGSFDVSGELAIKSRTTILQTRAVDSEANMTVDGVEQYYQETLCRIHPGPHCWAPGRKGGNWAGELRRSSFLYLGSCPG
jgi:hypothetical protein